MTYIENDICLGKAMQYIRRKVLKSEKVVYMLLHTCIFSDHKTTYPEVLSQAALNLNLF